MLKLSCIRLKKKWSGQGVKTDQEFADEFKQTCAMLKLESPIFLHFPASTSFSRAPHVSANAGALESKIARLLSSWKKW